MSLKIKDPEAHKLAQELARETGETMTSAVIQAIRERLERFQARKKQAAWQPNSMLLPSEAQLLSRGSTLIMPIFCTIKTAFPNDPGFFGRSCNHFWRTGLCFSGIR
jgi:hypothetical protein